jgi:hypothetical protein
MRTPEETALLLAVLFKRSGHKRARVSVKTVRRLSERTRIHYALIDMVAGHLNDFGLTLVEADRGGYGLIPSSALDGAPAITAKRYLADELRMLRTGRLRLATLRREVEEDVTDGEMDGEE